MSATFTQVKRTIDLAEKVKVDGGEKIVKTEKVGRKKNIEVTRTTKGGKFYVYFDGEKYAGTYRNEDDAMKVVKDYLKLVGEELTEVRGKVGSADGDEEADKNIMMQLRKVVTLRGMKPVEFNDGKKAKVNPKDAEKLLSIYDKLKPASKLQLQTVLAKSKKQFDDALKQLANFEEVELDEGKMKQLHDLIAQGKSAQEIAKELRLDLKTVKELMKESLNEAKEVLTRFRDDRLKQSTINLAKQKGLKVKDMGSKIEVSGNARKVMDLTLAVQKHDVKVEQLEEGKSSTGYELYHKDFSSAMKHAYDFAKRKFKIDVDPNEIDNKVASGPRKPSAGKTNSYRLLDKDGKRAIQVQVYNMDNKKYELNMYKEDVDLTEESKTIAKVREIATTKGASKVDGFMVDTFSASAIIQIYDKVNDANKAKMDKLKVDKLAEIAFKLMRKMREEVEVSLDELFEEKLEEKYTAKQYKMAFGVLNDPRWKGGNMTQIVNTIEKIAKGLSKDKAVARAIQLTNEAFTERELTPAELNKREKVAKDLPDAEFKKRYGDKWMNVKMATATNIAKGES